MKKNEKLREKNRIVRTVITVEQMPHLNDSVECVA